MINSLIKNSRVELSVSIASYPVIYLPLVRLLTRKKDNAVSQGTQLVIEGFPKSANTFAVAALKYLQNRPIKIAHHLHTSAKVKKAIHWGIPAIVLIRPPNDAVISLLIFASFRDLKRVLTYYSKFYSSVIPYRKDFILAPFDEVVTDFRSIIDSVRIRSNTNFKRVEHTQENLEAVNVMIEQMGMAAENRSVVTEKTVARPSKEIEKN